MRGIVLAMAVCCVMGTAVAATPPISGGEKGTTLDKLAGTQTLVTVVIKGTEAEDKNLRVVEVGDDYVSVASREGERHTYLFKSISKIVVQEGQEEVEEWSPAEIGLLPAQQQVLARALQRAANFFQTSNEDQTAKMDAAVLLAIGGESSAREDALQYLRAFHEGDDLATALFAAYRLYLIGRGEEIDWGVLDSALNSGNREIRKSGAKLAGLLGRQEAVPILRRMLKDRRGEMAAVAAVALARLDDRESLPTMLALLTERSPEKGEAAMFAVKRLADEYTTEQLKSMLPSYEGLIRFRIISVLFSLGDPEGERLLREESLQVPTLQVDAACLLARKGDIQAMRMLRKRLSERYDEDSETLIHRAEMAAALVAGGDRTVVPVLQDLLRTDMLKVQERVCLLLTELGVRSLSSIIQPSMESADPKIALIGSRTALAMGYPSFRDRLVELWK